MIDIVLQRLCVDVERRRVLDAISLRVAPGELVCLLGANGAGKTTLLRAALGLVPIAEGSRMIAGVDPALTPASLRARRVSYLPQARSMAWPIRVRDAVALGRFAHGAPPQRLRNADARAVDRALALCALESFAGRRVDTLSGGEQARVHIARTLATEAPVLLADEPTAALDPLHAFEVMDLIARFVADGGAALVSVHDIAEAARVATRLIVLKEGRILADGLPAAVLTPELLASAYGVSAEIGTLAGRTAVGVAGRI